MHVSILFTYMSTVVWTKSVIGKLNNNFLTHLDIYVTTIIILIDYGNNEIPMMQAVFYVWVYKM